MARFAAGQGQEMVSEPFPGTLLLTVIRAVTQTL